MNEVTLVCDGQKFTVSRAVLCNASPFFEAMFHSDFREAHTGQVNLETISADVMTAVLSFISTSNLPDFSNDPSACIKLLKASHLLQLPVLVTHCLCQLRNCLTPTYFFEPWTLATLYENRGLEAKILTVVASNFNESAKTNDFLQLTICQIKDILLHAEMVSLSVVDIFNEVLRWLEYDYINRGHYLQDLLKVLDLSSLSRSELKELIHTNSILRGFTETQLAGYASQSRPPANHALSKGTTLFCFGVTKTKRMQTMYSVSTNLWSHSIELQPPLTYGHYGRTLPIVFYGGYVAFVGFTQEVSVTEPATVVHRYCPFTNRVVSTCNLACSVTNVGASVLHGWIYVVSNPSDEDINHCSCNSVQRYSVTNVYCELVASTLEYHSSPYVFSFIDYLYVIGLSDGKGCVERYDSISDQWTIIASIPNPNPQSVCSATLCNGKLYVLKENDLQTFYIYSFHSKTWRRRMIEGNDTNMWELWPGNNRHNDASYLLGKDNFSVIYSCNTDLPLTWEKVSEPNADLWHWSHTIIMNN